MPSPANAIGLPVAWGALQPTPLVHEAYARLVDGERVQLQRRRHFFAVAAETRRRILVDHARKRYAAKRSGQGGLGISPATVKREGSVARAWLCHEMTRT